MKYHESNPWEVKNLEEFLYYCCPECEVKNHTKEIFLQHAIEQHPRAKDCISMFVPIAKPIFQNVKKEILEQEELIQNNVQEQCGLCGITFENQYDMKDHIAMFHEGQSEFECGQCGKCFDELSGLEMHVRKFHEELSAEMMLTDHTHKCPKPKCTFEAKAHKQLITHLMFHNDCYICGETFYGKNGKRNLERHVQRHGKSKATVCDMCHKDFKIPNLLKRHQARPYNLPDKVFSKYVIKHNKINIRVDVPKNISINRSSF